jgi:hypothetical protein
MKFQKAFRMVIKLNKDATIKEIKAVFRKISGKKRNPVNLDRYFGKVDFKVDGLTYQKKIRDE